MKLKKNVLLLTFFVFLFLIIYIFAAARPLGKELQMAPVWTIDIRQTADHSQKTDLLPFRLGQTMGYFTADGKIASMYTFPYKASISRFYYAQYGSDAADTAFYKPDGIQAGIIVPCGFPFFDENRIFLFMPGGTSFMQCNSDGSEKWRYEGAVPITAFSSSPAGCVAGFADGTICSFTADGRPSQAFTPGGSDYPVILGADISSDGKYIACMSGQNRQRIVLAKCEREHSIITFFKYFDRDQTRQVLVKFSKKNDVLYYNYAGGLGVVKCLSGKHTEIPVKGWIITIQESETGNTIYVLSRDESTYTVYILEDFDNLLGSFSFSADSAFILAKDNSLYIGRNTQISRLTFAEK